MNTLPKMALNTICQQLDYGTDVAIPDTSHMQAVTQHMKILAIGDLHIRHNNVEDTMQLSVSLQRLVREMRPDIVVLLGDILHTHERVHSMALNRAYELIHKLREYAHVYILVGNHDYINNTQFMTANHWMNALKEWSGVTVIDSGYVKITQWGKILFCPYVQPGMFSSALEYIDRDWKSAKLVFCHQEFKGSVSGGFVSVDGDEWSCDYPLVISGHIHQKQYVGENVFYTGTPIQHSYADTLDKTVTMCTLDNIIHLEHISLDIPVKVQKTLTIDDVYSYVPKHGGRECIILEAWSTETKQFRKSKKYRELLQQGVKIVFKNKVSPVSSRRNSVTEHADFSTLLLDLVEKSDPSLKSILAGLS